MSIISKDEAKTKYGITTKHEKMKNGELRFRLLSKDGSRYIRTVAGKTGEWQKSHYHEEIKETYIVQEGWMAYAELKNNSPQIRVFYQDGIMTTQLGIIHNVYLPVGAVIHTIKHGKTKNEDWLASEKFDGMTTHLTEAKIFKLGESFCDTNE